MKFIELNKTIKNKVSNLYNIIPGDDFLVKQAINIIKARTITNMEEFNFIRLEADKMKLNEFIAQLNTLPMMNDYRLVVAFNPSNEIMKYINSASLDASTVLVTVNANKLTVGESVDCSKLDKIDASHYIINYFTKRGQTITDEAVEYIMNSCNLDMSLIVNEINKLSCYTGSDPINLSTCLNLITANQEYVIFMLTSAIDNKNLNEYQKILSSMSEKMTYGEIFSYMGKYFKRMQYIALNKNDDELAVILNIKPYAVKKSRQNIAKNGVKYYINLYQRYVELDYKIKSGEITPYNAIFELVF